MNFSNIKVSEMPFDGQIGDLMMDEEGNLGTVTSVNDEMIETVYPNRRTLTPKWCYKAWHRKVEWGKQISLFTYMEGENGKDKSNNQAT